MKTIDFIVLLPLVYGFYEGYKRGFVLTLFGMIALLLGVVGGFKLMQVGINFLSNYFPHIPKLLPFISFIAIFIAIVVLVYLLGIIIKKSLNVTVFAGTLDNVAGAILNVFQWAFITSIVLWLCKQATITPSVYTNGAPVYQFIVGLAPKTVSSLSFMLPFSKGLFKAINEIF